MILTCTCVHPYQESRYGPGKRVHNPTKDGKAWRCTVCRAEQTVAGSGPAPKSKGAGR